MKNNTKITVHLKNGTTMEVEVGSAAEAAELMNRMDGGKSSESQSYTPRTSARRPKGFSYPKVAPNIVHVANGNGNFWTEQDILLVAKTVVVEGVYNRGEVIRTVNELKAQLEDKEKRFTPLYVMFVSMRKYFVKGSKSRCLSNYIVKTLKRNGFGPKSFPNLKPVTIKEGRVRNENNVSSRHKESAEETEKSNPLKNTWSRNDIAAVAEIIKNNIDSPRISTKVLAHLRKFGDDIYRKKSTTYSTVKDVKDFLLGQHNTVGHRMTKDLTESGFPFGCCAQNVPVVLTTAPEEA